MYKEVLTIMTENNIFTLKQAYFNYNLLKDDGFDISWIHGTPVPNWYTKLGYKPVLRWNKNGFIK